jgi:hypothetical protein
VQAICLRPALGTGVSAELFVYWRTAAPLLAHAQAAVQSLQSEWR